MEYQKVKPKTLVEDCFKLSLSDLPKGLLNPDKEIAGVVNKQKGLDSLRIEFKRIYKGRDFVLSLLVKKKNWSFNQDITLDFDSITFGIRPYLLCSCGKRCNTLYLKPNSYEFSCRECHSLVYELTTINKQVYGAELLYRYHRVLKIERMKERVKRISYNGQICKSAKAVMLMTIKWKMDSLAEKMINANTKGLFR